MISKTKQRAAWRRWRRLTGMNNAIVSRYFFDGYTWPQERGLPVATASELAAAHRRLMRLYQAADRLANRFFPHIYG